jgi:hypothetical protein
MSDNGGISMEQFNINELAGATGLILGAVSGILVVIFKSRCFCKFRIGFSDDCSLCMCERKPPPDTNIENNDTDDDDAKKELKNKKDNKKLLKPTKSKPQEDVEPDSVPDERLIPNDNLV